MIIKRKINKKTGSYDLIKFTPKKKDIEQDTTNQTQSPLKHPYFPPQHKKQLKYLQLPKIHSYHLHSVSYQEKKNSHDFIKGHSTNKIENRLLLMGYQYRKESSTLRDSKQVQRVTESKNRQKKDQRQETIEFLSKKLNISRDNAINRSIFSNSILSGLKISHVTTEKKKMVVYIEDGNNSRMVKQIFRKRPQLSFTLVKKQANIVWTQFCDYESSKLVTKFYEEKCKKNHTETEEDELYFSDQENSVEISKSLGMNSVMKNNNLKQRVQEVTKTLTHSSISVALQKQQSSSSNEEKVCIVIEQLHYHNHFLSHHEISDKKSLFSNLAIYCKKNRLDLFSLVPVTYELDYNKLKDKESNGFLPQTISGEGLWFIKPGEDTNRGNGISIASGRQDIEKKVRNLFNHGKTAIIQKYIEPFLYKNRKFDIRCYALVVCFRGRLKAYWYKQGYIRTCSKQFNEDPKDLYAHLTNDAIQKKSPLYGKYEQSNKLSFTEMDAYMKTKELSFKQAQQSMKMLAYYSIKSAQDKLKKNKNQFTFEIFGYDFLIDKKGKVWLIEVNTNPCLQFSGSLTSRIVWHMVDNSFKICVDPLLQQTNFEGLKNQPNRIFEDNRYECIV